MKTTLAERFWGKVAVLGDDDCWLWTASARPSGYGQFHLDGRLHAAHVLALELTMCAPANGRYALHSCDTPRCVNPRHLAWGTQSQNVQQAYDRGRRVGVTKPRSLTAAQVADIRSRYAARAASQNQLAAEFGVSQPLINHIVHHRRWGNAA